MHDFTLKEITNTDITKELETVGFDKSYIFKGVEKFEYKNIKVFSLTPAQANIVKQTAISVGCDCATHREVITGKIEKSDCIVGGSISQIKKIAKKLQYQPFGLKVLGESLDNLVNVKKSAKTKIVGILNLTDNSFSDGGLYNTFDKACEHLMQMIDEGADIIDIGAESTKPYSNAVGDKTQLEKLIPVIEFAKGKIPISIDTRSAVVAEKCIQAGADIINDVSGFDYDKNMADVAARYGKKVIIQHSKGTPDIMQNAPTYSNLVDEIFFSLKQKTDFALSKGINKENIIIDVGIGFGKTRKDNFELIKRIEEFYSLGCPVMLGVSRKSLLDMSDKDNFTKDIFTVALNTLAVERKVDYIRVHNVELHSKLLNMLEMFK